MSFLLHELFSTLIELQRGKYVVQRTK